MGRSIYHERPATCSACSSAFVAVHPRSKFCSSACRRGDERRRANEKRASNLEYFRAHAKATYARNAEAIKSASRAYGKSERGRQLQRARSAVRRATESERVGARTKLNNALRYGKMVRGPCRDCGSPNTHGHHHDYSKPLDVIWLCHEHHIAEHRRIDNG